MPFTRTQVVPPINPPVTIKFSGLMVLQPGPKDTCEIGVHKFDLAGHLFQIFVVVIKANEVAGQPPLPPTLIPLVTGPLTSEVKISLRPHPNADPEQGDFKVYARDPFDRTLTNSKREDYRWGINLRGKHLDAVINDGAKPIVRLKTGVLYSPDLTRAALAPQLICPGTTENLNHIAPQFAASIVPPAQTVAAIEWNHQGDAREFLMPRNGDPAGTLYTVYLINEPPNFDGLPHDELPLYYRILVSGGAPIPPNQRCELKFASGTRNDEIPCMPITLNP